MSDTYHPRPSRKDILAELAQVKRERDAANERAEHQAALKEQWIEHHDNVVALARKERRRLTAAEQRAEEAERRRRLADEMAERVEHGLCGETNSHGETRAHRDRLVKALENRPSCGWCNGSGRDGKDDCPQCEGTGLTDQARAALAATPPEPNVAKTAPTEGDLAGDDTPPEPEPADGEWVDIPGGLQKRVIHPPEPEDKAQYILPRDQYHRIYRGDFLLRQLVADLEEMLSHDPDKDPAAECGCCAFWTGHIIEALDRVGPPYVKEPPK